MVSLDPVIIAWTKPGKSQEKQVRKLPSFDSGICQFFTLILYSALGNSAMN